MLAWIQSGRSAGAWGGIGLAVSGIWPFHISRRAYVHKPWAPKALHVCALGVSPCGRPSGQPRDRAPPVRPPDRPPARPTACLTGRPPDQAPIVRPTAGPPDAARPATFCNKWWIRAGRLPKSTRSFQHVAHSSLIGPGLVTIWLQQGKSWPKSRHSGRDQTDLGPTSGSGRIRADSGLLAELAGILGGNFPG